MTLKRRLGAALLFGALPHPAGARFLSRGILYADPLDARGRAVKASSGVTQPATSWSWRALVRRLRPTLAVDVGANYGEMSMILPRSVPLLLAEPNPRLWRWLEQSLATRDGYCRMERRALSDRNGRAVLHTPSVWSGTASLAGRHAHPGIAEAHSETECMTARLDELVHGAEARRLALKIDVEGHEPAVIRGAESTIRSADAFVALVECDAATLSLSGTGHGDLLQQLEALGVVYHLADGRLLAGRPPGRADVVVVSDPALAEGIRVPWASRDLSR